MTTSHRLLLFKRIVEINHIKFKHLESEIRRIKKKFKLTIKFSFFWLRQ